MNRLSENDFKASVGKYGSGGAQCYNTVADQQMVQDLLNRIPESYGGTGGKLQSPPRWGVVSDALHQAIVRFQTVNAEKGLGPADGHVDPHERTLRLLLKIAYDYLFADDTIGNDLHFPVDDFQIRIPGGRLPVTPKLFRTSWKVTGSSSKGISIIVFAGGYGKIFLKRDLMDYTLAYSVAGASVSPIPLSVSYGPESMPQSGSWIWTYGGRDLQFQDLVGPIVVLTGAGALPPARGKAVSAIWFNAPLGVGLGARIAAGLGADKIVEALGQLNQSAGGVAYLSGEQWSSPDASISCTTGLAWPDH